MPDQNPHDPWASLAESLGATPADDTSRQPAARPPQAERRPPRPQHRPKPAAPAPQAGAWDDLAAELGVAGGGEPARPPARPAAPPRDSDRPPARPERRDEMEARDDRPRRRLDDDRPVSRDRDEAGLDSGPVGDRDAAVGGDGDGDRSGGRRRRRGRRGGRGRGRRDGERAPGGEGSAANSSRSDDRDSGWDENRDRDSGRGEAAEGRGRTEPRRDRDDSRRGSREDREPTDRDRDRDDTPARLEGVDGVGADSERGEAGGDDESRPRRRRRRGRRGGRGRSRSEAAGERPVRAERSGDAPADDDEPVPTSYGMRAPTRPAAGPRGDADRSERPAAESREGDDASEGRGRRRRRRRGGEGRSRKSEAGDADRGRRSGSRRSSGESRSSTLSRGRRDDFAPVAGRHDDDDEGLEFLGVEEAGQDSSRRQRAPEDDEILAESGLSTVLDVPSWVEAIGIVIAGNLDARNKSGRGGDRAR